VRPLPLTKDGWIELELHGAYQRLEVVRAAAPHDFAQGVDHRVRFRPKSQRSSGFLDQRNRQVQGCPHTKYLNSYGYHMSILFKLYG
jgi:hypothetical protein